MSAADPLLKRNKRTLYLVLGGAACLALPLFGVTYILINESAKTAPAAGAVFVQRANKAVPPKAPVLGAAGRKPKASPMAPTTAESRKSSLDFVKGGSDYYKQKQAPAPPPAAPPKKVAVKKAPAKKTKPAKKPFASPHLKTDGSAKSWNASELTPGPDNLSVGGRR